jgi:uncharacterized membrane protein YgdD (TMEM256/DUF423 family)
MSSHTLIRIGGFALVGAGGLAIGYALIAPDETVAGVFQNPNFVVGNVLNTARWLLMTFGLIALYLRQAERSRALNLVAFLTSFVAIILTAGLDIDKTFTLPYIASLTPGITSMANFAPNMPAALQPYLAIHMTTLLLHLVGLILVGAAVVRSKVLPVWAGWLLILGTVLSYGNLFGIGLLHTVGVIGVGAASVWLGVALLAPQAEASASLQPQLAK